MINDLENEQVCYIINADDAPWRSLMSVREQLDRSNLSKKTEKKKRNNILRDQ